MFIFLYSFYGDLPPISTSLQIHRLQFSGYCWRSKNEIVSQLLINCFGNQNMADAQGGPQQQPTTFFDQPGE